MSMPSAVDSQITDSVAQANVSVLALTPAFAMAQLYQATTQALANVAHNATLMQQQLNVTAEAVTTMSVSLLYSIESGATSTATQSVFA